MSAICGIVGESATGGRGRRDVSIMLEVLRPRGPESAIIHEQSDGGRPLAFGMRQVGKGGGQPVVARGDDPANFLIYDGTIFNARSCAATSRAPGASCAATRRRAVDAPLRDGGRQAASAASTGSSALAIWERRRQTLMLARDNLGVRAIYYRATPGGVIFASEIKALLAVPDVPAEIDEVGGSHYLTFLTVPGPRTLFRGISKLAAGSTATFGPAGGQRRRPAVLGPALGSGARGRRRELLRRPRAPAPRRAVSRRMIDGPVAALVSGGNDSSANASIMARKIREAGGDPKTTLHTFTVGLKELEGNPKYNDLVYAKQVADYIGSTHHEKLVSADEFLETIPTTIEALDDLVSEPSCDLPAPRARRWRRTRAWGSSCIGEANDELSCGHGEMIRIREGYYRSWLPFSKLPEPLQAGGGGGAQAVAQAHGHPAARGGRRRVLLELRDRVARVGEGVDPVAGRAARHHRMSASARSSRRDVAAVEARARTARATT